MKKEKLKSLITMAKRGTKYEKINAIAILKKLCKKHDLIFEELMEEDENLQEFQFEFKGKIPKSIAMQIYFKVIGGRYCTNNGYYIFLKTTKEKYIEFENAFSVYRRVYKKEQKKFAERQKKEKAMFQDAFIQRHDLFGEYTDEEKDERKEKAKKITAKEIEEIKLAMRMAGEMEEEAIIHKRLN